jgi:NAD(P)-dependent dehydrogenase (short-subunit alcohol dehydrogenase family)
MAMEPDGRRVPGEGRVVLITGGTGDLGQWVVEAFLAQGDRVHVPVFASAEAEGLRERLGDRAGEVRFHMEADLTRPESVTEVFEAVEATGDGPPVVLLNLAGGFTMAPVEETEPDAWDRMWRMNATTAFLCSRQAFPGMRAAGWGRIVNVSAFPALELGSPGLSAYGASKAAVLNLTRTLAQEGVEDGITVNAVLPSIIDTPGNRRTMPDQDRSRWLAPPEIAGVLRFLASEEARIVNGSALTLTLG